MFVAKLLFALACSFLGGMMTLVLVANLASGCRTYDRELWTPQSYCVAPD